MKYKQLCPKSLRPNKFHSTQPKRCGLCDCLLKIQHHLPMGKSIHESILINNKKTISYAECCRRYLNEASLVEEPQMICLKCCHNLQRVHSLHLDADELSRKIRRTCYKTKRLNRFRQSCPNNATIAEVKDELSLISDANKKIQPSANIPSVNSAFISRELFSKKHESNQQFSYHHTTDDVSYAQFMIDAPIPRNLSHRQKQSNDLHNEELSHDDERSLSSYANDDENVPKTNRLARRQYDFLIELPDQQSLNTFIKTSSSESSSRWTWRRTSSNSRGYKVYYVCNFSMRRHYHPCPAAMYALFNPEGTISVYSHGQHQHIPKNHLPLIISDQTKDEIFKCLPTDMSAIEIREHLIRLNLPFGDTKKLNNFIKYHRELLRFGAVTNVRLNGSAYRQPHYWTIRRSSPVNKNTTIL